MSRYVSKIREAATIAALTAVGIAVSAFAILVVRAIINRLFEGEWGFDWRFVAISVGIFGAAGFCVQFVYTFFKLRADARSAAILGSSPSVGGTRPAFVCFVAMEYYWLILNRTFVVIISPDALYGWKAEVVVSNWDKKYFQPYMEMLSDPNLIHSCETAAKLADLDGGFIIPRSEILSAEIIYGKKWGMGGIPHSGRIRLRLVSGAAREFILLGSVDT